MNRVERKRVQKRNRLNKFKFITISIFSFMFVIVLLYVGLTTVDAENREILLMDYTSLFDYNKIDTDNYKIIFCGDAYFVDAGKINYFVSKFETDAINKIKKAIDLAKEKDYYFDELVIMVNKMKNEVLSIIERTNK